MEVLLDKRTTAELKEAAAVIENVKRTKQASAAYAVKHAVEKPTHLAARVEATAGGSHASSSSAAAPAATAAAAAASAEAEAEADGASFDKAFGING